MKNFSMVITFIMVMFSCTPPEPIIIEVPVEKKNKLTLGKVQSQVKKGMNQTEILEFFVAIFGEPNTSKISV